VLNSNILRTIRTHFLFLFLADPLRLFFNTSVLTLLTAVGFFLAAVYNLSVGGVAVFFLMISLLLLLFAVIFAGFAIVLTRLRDQSVEGWVRDYPAWPPMRSRPREIKVLRADPPGA
jgi:uncharacterized membrane protein YhaH (DUF805 family)